MFGLSQACQLFLSLLQIDFPFFSAHFLAVFYPLMVSFIFLSLH